jgi:alpha-tubulin suppressor-like RCC1 family protein
VWCWGRNTNGELGNGTTTPAKVPVQVNLGGITLGSATIDQVSCSDGRRKEGSTCIRLSDGRAYCWGANIHGELGDGTTATTPRTAPTTAVDISGLGAVKIVQLVAAQNARCARTDDGSVWCWGRNVNGLLGINDPDGNTELFVPTKVNVLSTAAALDMSHHLACAVDGAKHVLCWGTNRRGQALAKMPVTEADGMALVPTQVMF